MLVRIVRAFDLDRTVSGETRTTRYEAGQVANLPAKLAHSLIGTGRATVYHSAPRSMTRSRKVVHPSQVK